MAGLSYIEVLLATALIAITLVPAMEALTPALQGAAIHESQSAQQFHLAARLETLLVNVALTTPAETAPDSAGFGPEKAAEAGALLGDVRRWQGERVGANQAYERALAADSLEAFLRERADRPSFYTDLKRALEQLAPESGSYEHDATWGDGNGFAHLRSALVGASLCLPVENGAPVLGTWQQVVFLDSSGRSYSLAAHTLPSARGQGEPLTGRFNPPAGASFVAVLGGDPEQWWQV